MKDLLPLQSVVPIQMILLSLLIPVLSGFAQDVPAAPSGFIATPNGTTYQITLNWSDNSDNESEFIIVREDPESCCHYFSTAANTSTFTDTEVLANVLYTYRLAAANENGASEEVEVSSMIIKAVPPAPGNVSASTGPTTTIEIAFTDNSDLETYYEIQHSSNPDEHGFYGSKTATGGEIGSIITAYINDEPANSSPTHIHYPPNTTVYIRVRGIINDNGQLLYGPFSPVVSAVTRDYPTAPSNLMLTLEGDQLKLSWTDNSDNEAAFFISRYRDNTTFIEKFVVDANTTSFIDPTAEIGTQYTYQIQALDAYEVTIPFDFWSFTPGRYVEITGSVQPSLAAPTIVEAIGTSPLHFRVTFIDTNELEDAYDVHFDAPDISYGEIWTTDGLAGSGDTIVTEPSYDFGQSLVYIKVRAFTYDPVSDTYHYGPFSETVTARAMESFPVPPSDFTAVIDGPYIRLNWTDNSSSNHEFDEASFIIMRADDTPINFNTLFTLPANTSTFLDTTVLPGHTYAYRLEALNEYGQGNEVFTVVATAPENSLETPVAKPATFVTPKSFTANWTPVENADYYQLYVYTAHDSTLVPGYDGIVVVDSMAQVTDLRANMDYYYGVIAANESVESGLSNFVTVAPVKHLMLQTVCSPDPDTYRRWKIVNDNPFPVTVKWDVPATGESGTTIALAGESYFETQTASGKGQANFVRITWTDDKMTERTSLKNSSKKACTETFATGAMDELTEVNSFLLISAYPNPALTTMTLHISSTSDAEVTVAILNLQGKRMLSKTVSPNKNVDLDIGDYASGIYVIRAVQGRTQRWVKVIKQ